MIGTAIAGSLNPVPGAPGLRHQVLNVDERVLSDLLVLNLRRMDQVFGPDHVFALILRWLLQLLGQRFFFTGPTGVKAHLVDATTVAVSWKAPKSVDPAWDRFIVAWGLIGTLEEKRREIPPSNTSTILKDLGTGRQYQICVRMGNENGEGVVGVLFLLPCNLSRVF